MSQKQQPDGSGEGGKDDDDRKIGTSLSNVNISHDPFLTLKTSDAASDEVECCRRETLPNLNPL